MQEPSGAARDPERGRRLPTIGRRHKGWRLDVHDAIRLRSLFVKACAKLQFELTHAAYSLTRTERILPQTHVPGKPAYLAAASQFHRPHQSRAYTTRRHRPAPARSGKARSSPWRDASSTPRSVIRPVTSRAGVTSKP